MHEFHETSLLERACVGAFLMFAVPVLTCKREAGSVPQAAGGREGWQSSVSFAETTCSAAPSFSARTMLPVPRAVVGIGNAEGARDERPRHEVRIGEFALDATEVTVGDFACCVRAGRCAEPQSGRSCNWGKADRAQHPVNCVDWHQARDYCGWVGARLPTEEEWEYAASGGDGRKYPWGNEEPQDSLCWRRREHGLGTCEVGVHAGDRSPFGVMDMAGNVKEWTASGYSKDYSSARSPTQFVIRGGSWGIELSSIIRVTLRDAAGENQSTVYTGIRCAR